MTTQSIITELQAKGNESIKKILLKHGVKEPFFGVKIEDLKVIQKKVKKDYQLSKGLYATGNSDAMYLAGLIADEDKMTKADLSSWAKQAVSKNISGYTVPWIAAESHFGYELSLDWINADKASAAAMGWATLSSLVAIKPDSELDLQSLKKLLRRVEKEIPSADNEVRAAMNGFVIAAGCYVISLTDDALKIAGQIESAKANAGSKLPSAASYILKMKDKGSLGKKKKMARC